MTRRARRPRQKRSPAMTPLEEGGHLYVGRVCFRDPPTAGSSRTRPTYPNTSALNLRSTNRRVSAADVINPVDIALVDRCAVRERTAVGQHDAIDDRAGDHIALEER